MDRHLTEIKKTKSLLLLFGLLLLTAEVTSGSTLAKSPKEEKKLNNVGLLANQQQAKALVSPIPGIITKLGGLACASMQQLDTALRWPIEIHEEINITDESTSSITHSQLIEYPQSYRTTAMQINQQLTKALRAVNSNAEEIDMELISAPEYIDTLIRYIGPYFYKKSNTFGNLILLPLNGLKKLSEKSTLLSSQSASKLQEVANLTKAFADTSKSVFLTKVKYLESKLNGSFSKELAKKLNYKKELEKHISSLNDEHQKWERCVTDALKNTEQKEMESSENEQETDYADSVENQHAVLNDKDCYSETEEESNNFQKAVDNEHKITIILIEKKEELLNLSKDIMKLEHKKNRLEKEISLLVNTTDSIEQLGKQMEELAVGWNNLTSYCQNIQLVVETTRKTILQPTFFSSEEQLKKIKNKVLYKEIRGSMDLVSRLAKFFVNVYNSNLSSLAAQLDQMMSISNKSPATLKKTLTQASVNSFKQIDDMLMKEFSKS